MKRLKLKPLQYTFFFIRLATFTPEHFIALNRFVLSMFHGHVYQQYSCVLLKTYIFLLYINLILSVIRRGNHLHCVFYSSHEPRLLMTFLWDKTAAGHCFHIHCSCFIINFIPVQTNCPLVPLMSDTYIITSSTVIL